MAWDVVEPIILGLVGISWSRPFHTQLAVTPESLSPIFRR
jgi:hypothetical protein